MNNVAEKHRTDERGRADRHRCLREDEEGKVRYCFLECADGGRQTSIFQYKGTFSEFA